MARRLHVGIQGECGRGGRAVSWLVGCRGLSLSDRRQHHGDALVHHARLTCAVLYCCTSMSGLPSGSRMAASVGPPGTSNGCVTTWPPSWLVLSSEAVRSRTCT